MKKISFVAIILCVLSFKSLALANNLLLDRRFWIEEISNNNGILNDKILKKTDSNSELDFTKGMYSESIEEKDLKRKAILTIAGIIKHNESDIRVIQSYKYYDVEYNHFFYRNILNAIIYNHSVKTIIFDGIPRQGASKIAQIIESNKNIEIIICDNSDFDDDGMQIISNALKENNTLKKIEFLNSKFSMDSRELVRKAWQHHPVNGRKSNVKF